MEGGAAALLVLLAGVAAGALLIAPAIRAWLPDVRAGSAGLPVAADGSTAYIHRGQSMIDEAGKSVSTTQG